MVVGILYGNSTNIYGQWSRDENGMTGSSMGYFPTLTQVRHVRNRFSPSVITEI